LLFDNNTVEVRHLDLEVPDSFAESVSGCDAIVCAAGLSAQECALQPAKAITTYLLGVTQLAKIAKKNRVKKWIQLSTVHVYGTPRNCILTENSTCYPDSVYGAIHLAIEENLSLLACDTFQLSIARVANVFGAPLDPRSNAWGLVANQLCKQAVLDRKMVLNSSGLQTRDFIFVEDAINAILELLLHPISSETNSLRVVNVSSGSAVSLRHLAIYIKDQCREIGIPIPELEHLEDESSAPQKVGYSNLALRHLGWNPTFSLKHALNKTLVTIGKLNRRS
jgi:UDP-glucose 4-epimerase